VKNEAQIKSYKWRDGDGISEAEGLANVTLYNTNSIINSHNLY